MSKTTLRLALAIAALCGLLQAAEAAAYCDTACTPTTSCTRTCRDGPGGDFITCGDYGVCQDGGGTCYPNFKPVSSTAIGAFQVNYYTNPPYCEHIVAQRTTWHDQNNCPGSADYTTCGYYVNATRPDLLCCYFFWCGGSTC